MKQLAIALIVFFLAPAASADIGDDWYAAFTKGKGKAAAKVTIDRGLKYGDTGKDSVIADKVAKHYSAVFRKLRKKFRKLPLEKGNCTTVGRELGYMSNEWREKNEDVSVWIRRLPQAFCENNDIVPPRVWLIKNLEGDDVPHAVVLFATGEDDKITGFYHF